MEIKIIKIFLKIIFIYVAVLHMGNASVKFQYFGAHANTFVKSMEKDSVGRLWLGTEKGVVLFDGVTFKHPTKFQLIEDKLIYSIRTISRDSLIILADGKVYYAADVQANPTINEAPSWFNDGFVDCKRIQNRLIFLNGINKFILISDLKLNIIKKINVTYPPIKLDTYNDIACITGNNLNIDFFKLLNDSLVLIKSIDDLEKPGTSFSNVLLKKDKLIVAPYYGGVYIIKNYLGNYTVQEIESLKNIIVYDIHEDVINKDHYWSGSHYHGIYYFNEEKVLQNEEYASELDNLLVNSIYTDKKGRIFAGTQYGLSIIKNIDFERLYLKDVDVNNFIWNIKQISEDEFWIATSHGIATLKYQKGKYILGNDSILNYFSNKSVFKIIENNNTQYLIFSKYPYVASIKDKKLKIYNDANLSNTRLPIDEHFDDQGRLWLCTYNFLYLKDGKATTLKPESDKQISTTSLDKLPNGNMVFGTNYNGLFETDGKKVWHLKADKPITHNIIQVYFDHLKNKLLVTAYNIGLYEYDFEKKTYQESAMSPHIAGKDVYYLKIFGDSLYVFGSNLGLSLYFVNQNKWNYLNTSNGLTSNEINEYCIAMHKDNLLVGTAYGLNIIPKKKLLTPYELPKIYFTNIKPAPKNGKILLPFRNNSFETNIGVISYTTDNVFKVFFRIDGIDTSWINLESYSIFLRNLSPGKYKLRTKIYWRDSLFSAQEESIDFEVFRPFWYSVYGIIIGVIILLTIIYVLVRIRTYRYTRLANKLRKELRAEQIRSSELENLFTEIFDNSALGIVFLKPNGDITSSNKAADKILAGNSKDIPKNIFQLEMTAFKETISIAINEIEENKIDKKTVDIQLEDKIENQLRFYFWKVNFKRKWHIGVLISDLSTIIRQKSMEAQLQAYNQVLATLAHYLNNAMTVLGLAEQNYQIKPNEKHARLAEIAKISVKKVKFILNLLDRSINSPDLKFRDYVDAKNLLIDIEEEIKSFQEKVN